MQRALKRLIPILLLAYALLVGCQTATPEANLPLTLKVDGQTRDLTASPNATIADVLREAGVTLGDLDRVNPPTVSRVEAGTTITVVRVTEETTIIQEAIPFDRRTTLNEGLPVGEQRLLQAGANGVAEITFRVTYEDGAEVSRTEIRRIVVTSPQPEVIMIGSQGDLPPVAVNGTLAYISSGNAWIIRRNSSSRRALTIDGGVDGRVFQLSKDGKRLLFSRTSIATAPTATPGTSLATAQPTPTASGGPFNTLWMVMDTGDPLSNPVQLKLSNILWADFAPTEPNAIFYSTAEPRPNFPGWQANNDLWMARLNNRGVIQNHKLLLEPSSGGIYGWYGTVYQVSPDGTTLAWAQADAVGILIPGEKENPAPGQLPGKFERQTLLNLTPLTAFDIVWVPSLAWSPNGTLIATTTHGAPVAGEPAEDSPAFNMTILPVQGGYSVDVVDRAGMWSAPQFAPADTSGEGLAAMPVLFLKALQPLDSVRSRYQLMLADRDGSGARALYPTEGQPGIAPQIVEWSPDGTQIALTIQGNLVILDIGTGIIQQLTQDGSSSSPLWRQ